VGCFVPVTLRAPRATLLAEIVKRQAEWRDHGIQSLQRIGDALAPGTVAAAVYAGTLAARDLGSSNPGYFRRERVVL
jgi:dimethylamine/trimethylamine dehydrogenase